MSCADKRASEPVFYQGLRSVSIRFISLIKLTGNGNIFFGEPKTMNSQRHMVSFMAHFNGFSDSLLNQCKRVWNGCNGLGGLQIQGFKGSDAPIIAQQRILISLGWAKCLSPIQLTIAAG